MFECAPKCFSKGMYKVPCVSRVCAVNWIGFSLQLKVLDVPNILYEEECWIDTKKRFAQLKSRPVGFQNYAVLTESSTFSQASENPNWYIK